MSEIYDLENKSINTSTTFPLTKEELVGLFEDGYIAYGYKEGGKLIAKVGFIKMAENTVELDVCVGPEFQGKGIGKSIMEAAIEDLLSHKNWDVFLKVHPKNPALKLYEKIGFTALLESNGDFKLEDTGHGPRVTMNFIPS